VVEFSGVTWHANKKNGMAAIRYRIVFVGLVVLTLFL